METSTRIPVPGTYNFRDVGGLPAAGGTVRDGVLFRSDGLHRLGEAGRAELRQLGVGIVIDLRDENEARFMPDDLDGLDVEVLSLPGVRGLGCLAGRGRHLARRPVRAHRHPARLRRRERAARDRERGRPVGGGALHRRQGPHRHRRGARAARRGRRPRRRGRGLRAHRGEPRRRVARGDGGARRALRRPRHPRAPHPHGRQPARGDRGRARTVERAHGSTREYLLASGLSLHDLAALERLLIDPA